MGVLLSSGRTRVGFSLRAIGYGASLTALRGASPRATANRVIYRSAALREWYRNGPLGLEQGFTIPRPPSGVATARCRSARAFGERARLGQIRRREPHAQPPRGPSPRYGALRASDTRGSSDGNTALVGGPEDYAKTGVAWVFTRSESKWTQQGSKLIGNGEVSEPKPKEGEAKFQGEFG